MITRLMPTTLRVAITAAREDARSIVRAFREPRNKGCRIRELPRPVSPSIVATVAQRPAPRAMPVEEEAVLVFSLSGVELVVPPGQTILEAGLGAGVDLLFSCTLGGCGACMLQVVEGSVDYDDREAICLTDDEIEEGCCLACVGRPRGRLVLEA